MCLSTVLLIMVSTSNGRNGEWREGHGGCKSRQSEHVSHCTCSLTYLKSTLGDRASGRVQAGTVSSPAKLSHRYRGGKSGNVLKLLWSDWLRTVITRSALPRQLGSPCSFCPKCRSFKCLLSKNCNQGPPSPTFCLPRYRH